MHSDQHECWLCASEVADFEFGAEFKAAGLAAWWGNLRPFLKWVCWKIESASHAFQLSFQLRFANLPPSCSKFGPCLCEGFPAVWATSDPRPASRRMP